MTELSESHDDPFAPHLAALVVLDDRAWWSDGTGGLRSCSAIRTQP
ncbi:hypothetical protein [Streptomyces violaceus]